MENENIKRKDPAKGKIILFIIGVLVGAIIATAGFVVYSLTLGANNNTTSTQQMQGGGTPPEMPSGEMNGEAPSGTPPEMQNNTNTESTNN